MPKIYYHQNKGNHLSELNINNLLNQLNFIIIVGGKDSKILILKKNLLDFSLHPKNIV